MFFLLPLFLELVSGPSSSSAFCSASKIANCSSTQKGIRLVYKWMIVYRGKLKQKGYLIKDRFKLLITSVGKIKTIFTELLWIPTKPTSETIAYTDLLVTIIKLIILLLWKEITDLSGVFSMFICCHLPVHICTLIEVFQGFSGLSQII